MGKAIIGLVLLLLINISIFGQVSDFERIFNNKNLMQLVQNTLTKTNFADVANGKTIVLTSLMKGCKWRLEEVAFYNKLKKDYPNKFDVFVTFTDDIAITSKYIQEVNFDFVYIYDPQMTLSHEFFPEDTIFSVLFDTNGNIQEKTISNNLDRDQISKQLNKDNTQSSIKQSNNLPILNFQIKRYALGDKVSSNLSSVNIPTKIMTGFKANEIIDTIENIKICTLSGKNILELYSFAYDLPKSRFTYDNELEFINSHSPDHRYTLFLSVSNLHSDLNEMLIQQINLNFGLEISEVFQEKEVLILSKIDTDKGKIKIVNSLNDDKTLSEISEDQFQLSTNYITPTEISKYIEEATMLPVEVRIDPKLRYSLDISIENNDRTINSLIKQFSENGLIIEKEKKEIKCLKINMRDTNITTY